MSIKNIETKVENILEPIINNLGYDLYDVIYEKEGKDYYLRIIIDKLEGIDINDCEKVNNEINDILDEKDYIKEQYFLEVSSPGIERTLRKQKHLEQNLGAEVVVSLFQAINHQKQIEGILKQFDENTITIQTNEQDLVIERKSISHMKTKYNW